MTVIKIRSRISYRCSPLNRTGPIFDFDLHLSDDPKTASLQVYTQVARELLCSTWHMVKKKLIIFKK